jgi:nucleotide-binding universal stress UspA family protein
MTESILCPVDFSECSHAALAHALVLAQKSGAKLDVLHAYYLPPTIQPNLMVWAAAGHRSAWGLAEERARSEFDEFLVAHGPDIRQRTDLHLVHADPTSAILDFASRHGSALIVMGTHGRTGAARLVMGSVAERVVRAAPCPVLTVHEPPKARPEPQPAARVPQTL